MRFYIIFILFFYSLCTLTAQQGSELIAVGTMPYNEVAHLSMPVLDNEALLSAELQRRSPGVAPKFAKAIAVDIRPETGGTWEYLPNGQAVWRLSIRSSDAYSINLGFTEYYMPPGGQMILYDPAGEQVMGPFTPSDNEVHNELWTPVFPGDELMVEVQLPVNEINNLRLWLTSVNHDFVDFMSIMTGSCHLDAICSAEDGFPILDLYRDIIQSVAVIGQGGDTFCTGFLVNTTRNDCTPYFMTAHHCNININNDQTVFAYWNYQNSYCRPPGSEASGAPGDGLLNNFNTGTIWRAGHQATDFTLLEFDDPIPNTADAFFAGWSREATPPQDTLICVHHPDGAEKRVSIAFEDAYPGNWGGGNTEYPDGNHLIVPDWTIGSTESGSSGAPLFNSNKQVTGQLHGGGANCSNDLYDSFGWFRSSWNGGGTPFTRLKDWLDPDNLNPLEIDGRWMSNCSATITLQDATAQSCSPGQALFYIEVSEHFPANVILSTTGLPAGSSVEFSPNPASPGSISSLLVGLPDGLPSGSITFEIHASDGWVEQTAIASILISAAAPAAPTPILPVQNAVAQSLRPTISWGGVIGASWYEMEIAEDDSFDELAYYETGIYSNTLQPPPLAPYTEYYYRIRGHNLCGASPWSAIRRFTTAATNCTSRSSSDIPKTIIGYANETVVSNLQVNQSGTIASISVRNLEIDHTYIGDLIVLLESPSGTRITLFDQPGYPTIPFGCNLDNIRVNIDDQAALTNTDLENMCSSAGEAAISGTFQPAEPLGNLIGESSNGVWKLIVVDRQNQDGGKLLNWALDICYTYPDDATEVYLPAIEACTDTLYTGQLFVGYGFQDSVFFNVYSTPSGVNIHFEQQPAAPGTYVDFTISDLDNSGNFTFILSAGNGLDLHLCNVPIDVVAQPIAPLLFTPDNESPVFQEEQQFSWSLVPGIDTFVLTVGRDFALNDVVLQAYVTEDYYPMLEGLEGGVYFWNVASVNRCGNIHSETFSFYKEGSTTAVSQEEEGSIRIFPNPTSGQLNVSLPQAGNARGMLYHPSGAVVRSFQFNQKASIEVGDLASGLYLLRVQQGEKLYIRRVIVSAL